MKPLFISLVLTMLVYKCAALGIDPFVVKTDIYGSFTIAKKGKVAALMLSENEHAGVGRAVTNLQNDLKQVTGIAPLILTDKTSAMPIIIGTIGHSKLIDQLISTNKINVAGIAGNWESTLIQVVEKPFPGVEMALVIAGSDKRGTIYGVYELSYQIGVSPWYYWADVPIKKAATLYALAGRRVISSPAVKYRGIFLNDEAPALSGWSKKQFGGFNHQFYEKVFELILRLKGNYLWPAMWGSAFADDDKLNPVLADEYGVVIGTSHHEPLTRAHDEWRRIGGGKWNYEQNPQQLREFWETGLKRVADKEQLITIGMRGDGDEPMSAGTATALLERIVKDQREIIEKVTHKPAAETPQVWALYKEVQDYYDKGMRVPDDVTLLLADDNWGNIRKLPKLNEAPRKGGYGIYYHFDYVGGPRNYKWINTNPIQKIWEQMHLAYEYQANQIWIVNVGDLKPMEFPMEFFLDYAWAPDAIPSAQLKNYTIQWATKQFGDEYAPQIAELIDLSSKYNGRVKPELLQQDTYSLLHYREFENVVADFKRLYQKAKFIDGKLLVNQRDAYYQLVLHPIEASTNLYELYFTVAKNKLAASQGRASTNSLAKRVDSLFKRDAEISKYYNKIMAKGKWDHMMDQTHIGYTSWQQPEKNIMPEVIILTPTEVSKNNWGVSIEGKQSAYYQNQNEVFNLPIFDRLHQSRYFDIFNAFNVPIKKFNYQITGPSYVHINKPKGEVIEEERIELGINWDKAPAGKTNAEVLITGENGSTIKISITINNPINEQKFTGFIASDGVVAMEATSYSRAINSRPILWKTIPNYGKTNGGVMPVPVTSPPQNVNATTPHLEYDIYVDTIGTFDLYSYISPTIDFTGGEGLRFAVSIDDEKPIKIDIGEDYKTDKQWEKSVANSIKIFKTQLKLNVAGKHVIKYWMINPGVVVQKLVLDLGGLKPSYLGPPETFVSDNKNLTKY
jgi:hypothetical protein